MHHHPNASARPALTNLGCATRIVIFGLVYAVFLYSLRSTIASAILAGIVTTLVYALLYGGPVAASLVSQWRAGRRAEELREFHLEVDDEEIRQLTPSGAVVARIKLSEPFQFHDLYREEAEAIYRLYQGNVKLDFHTSDPQAERILTDILGVPWPPKAIRLSP